MQQWSQSQAARLEGHERITSLRLVLRPHPLAPRRHRQLRHRRAHERVLARYARAQRGVTWGEGGVCVKEDATEVSRQRLDEETRPLLLRGDDVRDGLLLTEGAELYAIRLSFQLLGVELASTSRLRERFEAHRYSPASGTSAAASRMRGGASHSPQRIKWTKRPRRCAVHLSGEACSAWMTRKATSDEARRNETRRAERGDQARRRSTYRARR